MIYIYLMKLRRSILLLLVGVSVISCVSTPRNSYCEIATPIYLEENDVNIISESLVNDLLIHNKTYERLCNER